MREFPAFCRQTKMTRTGRSMDAYALTAWTAQVIIKAKKLKSKMEYIPGSVKSDLMTELSKLSIYDDGPLRAIDFLKSHGITLVIEQHLPRTYLDGAVVLSGLNQPIIGLTLRHDRIDNFWFSLMHEMAHLSLHLDSETPQFFDNLDVIDNLDEKEIEADNLARESLIPTDEWKRSPASKLRSPDAVNVLANKLAIHPAIVAGRMRYEFKAYRLLNNLVGHKQVRKLFTEINWRGNE